MATLRTDNLTPLQLGRLNRVLDQRYRYGDGVRTLREQIERLPPIKQEWDGMGDFSRTKFNRMNYAEQREYEAKLKARRYYTVGGFQVPKIVYDAVVGPVVGPIIGALQ